MQPWPNIDFGGKPVVVTGANGFIGRRLVAGLIASNAKVTVLLRSNHGQSSFQSCGATAIVCKLKAGPQLDNALKGQSILFHFAYDVRANGADNLNAFAAIHNAAKRNGIERIVHASSIVVYDNWPNGELNEASPISTATGGDYRQSKIAMESALLMGDIPSAILQPTIVYGPGSAQWTDAPIASLRRGPVVLPDPTGICPAVYVDDVVAGALLAAADPNLSQERFILSGPDHITWADFYTAYAKRIGTGTIQLIPMDELRARIPPPDDRSPQAGPSLSARVSREVRKLVGNRRFEQIISTLRTHLTSSGPVFPNYHLLSHYCANPHVSYETAHARLGYAPQYDLMTGMTMIDV